MNDCSLSGWWLVCWLTDGWISGFWLAVLLLAGSLNLTDYHDRSLSRSVQKFCGGLARQIQSESWAQKRSTEALSSEQSRSGCTLELKVNNWMQILIFVVLGHTLLEGKGAAKYHCRSIADSTAAEALCSTATDRKWLVHLDASGGRVIRKLCELVLVFGAKRISMI